MLPAILILAMDLHQPKIPIHFEPNQGQVAGGTEWIAKAHGGVLFITGPAVAIGGFSKPAVIRFAGANAVHGKGLDPTGGSSSRFVGRDQNHWQTAVPHFAKVLYRGLYDGVDLIYYGAPDGNVEYDFRIAPRADVKRIELAFSGFDKVEVDDQGDLLLWQGSQRVKQHRPKAFQKGREVPCAYQLINSNRVRLKVEIYDEGRELTVDPVLDFSSYFGGPGGEAIYGTTIDQNGFIYIAGTTQTPASPSLNPFQQPNLVNHAAFVVKLSPNADRILLFVELNGTTGATVGRSVSVDSAGAMFLLSFTSSPDLPLKNAFQKNYTAAYQNGYIAKLAPDGRSFVYASYYGGSGGDTVFRTVMTPEGGQVFSGNTSSHDLPVVNAIQPAFGGGTNDCFIAKVDARGALVFSTYFGGSDTDYCYAALAVDSTGQIYFGGMSYSDDLPLKNPIQSTRGQFGFGNTPFLARLSADGRELRYASFIGGGGSGGLGSIAVNSRNEVYLGIIAENNQFTTNNAFQPACESLSACGYLMKLDPTGQQVLVSTYFSGTGFSSVEGVVVGPDDTVYVGGSAETADFPTKGSLQPFLGGGVYNQDLFLAKFSPDLRTLIYSTFLGGSRDDEFGEITVDTQGRLYVVGWTDSTDFPLQNALQPTNGGGYDGFLARISDSTATAVSPLIATPGLVNMRYVQGGSPPSQDVQISGDPISFTASSDGAWVTVLPQTGTAPVTLKVGGAVLNPGVYNANVTLTPTAGAPLVIPVTMTILTAAPVLSSVDPSFIPLLSDNTTVTFHGSGFTPQTQLRLGPVTAWGSPIVFVDAQTLQTTMSYLSFLAAGSYQFSAVNPQSDVSGTVTVSVGGLTPVITSVVNAASQLTGPVASGELIQVNGTNFGPPAQLGAQIGGLPATIISSTDTQALLLVPTQPPSAINAGIVFTSSGLISIPATVPLTAAAPGLFTADNSGTGQALITGTPSPGSTIVLFGTGVGDLTLPITVSINGEDSPVTAVGPVQDQPGWFQVTITIPSDVSTDAPVSVVLSVAGQQSQPNVTLGLQVN